MDMRCPKHDRIFETITDHRKPGAGASADGNLPGHPVDGHPDCPKCQEETHVVPVALKTRVSNTAA